MIDARERDVIRQLGPRPDEPAGQPAWDAWATTVRAQLCTRHGHVWLETDGTPHTRHRGRKAADVPVTCKYCNATASLPTFAANTAPPQQPTIGSVPKP